QCSIGRRDPVRLRRPLAMRVLLDTHLLLWALSSPERLSNQARQRTNSSEVYASAASIWEISIKSTLGKLKAAPNEVLAGAERTGFEPATPGVTGRYSNQLNYRSELGVEC